MKENGRRKLMENGVGDHATWWVVTTKISARPPLESFFLIKIRPKGRGDNTHSSSHNICAE